MDVMTSIIIALFMHEDAVALPTLHRAQALRSIKVPMDVHRRYDGASFVDVLCNATPSELFFTNPPDEHGYRVGWGGAKVLP